MKKLTLSFLLCLPFIILLSQTPFSCDGSMFVVDYHGQVYRITFDRQADTVELSPLSKPTGFLIHSIAYNRKDNFIYGTAQSNGITYICRIDSSGEASLIKPIPYDTTTWQFLSAADVTPDGSKIIFLTAPKGNITEPNLAITFDLGSGNYEMDEILLETLGGAPQILTGDIAFHPLTEQLFSFDYQTIFNNQPNPHGGKTVIIDPSAGIIDNLLFFQNPVSYEHTFSLMFDPFGNLFGIDGVPPMYGRWAEINTTTGILETILMDSFSNVVPAAYFLYDGCSCPYTISIEKTVTPDTTYACTEVLYKFRISNLTKNLQDSVTFRDSLPPGFLFTEIVRNPFGGQINGLNTNTLEISGINLPYGIDSLMVKVMVPEGAEGVYLNQAVLTDADLSGTNQTMNSILSDNPATIAKRDATPLTILPLVIDLDEEALELCKDSSLILRPLNDTTGISFLWSNGSNASEIRITQSGEYSVTVTGGCERDSATFLVIDSPLSVSLGPDTIGQFGDLIQILPSYDFLSPIITNLWSVSGPGGFTCENCEEVEFLLQENTLVTLWVKNEAGCVAIDELKINAMRKIFAPNAFSPNNDGINDLFYLQSKHSLPVRSFKIFDRWGGLIFTSENGATNDPYFGWDGKAKRKDLQGGIYAWFAEIEFPDGEKIIYSGDVVLIK